MQKIKICYTTTKNLGDLLNPIIIKEIFKYDPIWVKPSKSRISCIGSGLMRYFIQDNELNKSKKRIIKYKLKSIYNSIFDKGLIIWSSGFINHIDEKLYPLRKNVKIASVRGELSKKKLEEVYGDLSDVTTGDAGLLSSLLIPKPWIKKYKLGIIPHISEREEKIWNEIKKANDNSIIIDVTDDPMKNLKIISECECIISSSLHGLIISDSFNIPNIRVHLTDKLYGDGFKFDDYYSSLNIKGKILDLNNNSRVIDTNKIINNYDINEEQIIKKQQEIKNAFYKFLK